MYLDPKRLYVFRAVTRVDILVDYRRVCPNVCKRIAVWAVLGRCWAMNLRTFEVHVSLNEYPRA